MQTITEIRGQCSAPISHTSRRCSCTEFVSGVQDRPQVWGFICKRCHHTEGVHQKVEAAR